MSQPPKTNADWCLWRIRVEYAVFLALKSLDDLAQYFQLKDQRPS